MQEAAVVFGPAGEEMLGILHAGAPHARRGVLVVVGGPQYRVGSHRQFLLLARHLARDGVSVLRFDYRGMGDSGGARRDFEAVSEDIRMAIDAFIERSPGLDEVVIWGLCDAAAAALMYAGGDRRVAGLVLLNPWVRTEEGIARAYLRHYYLQRLASPGFWAGLLRGRFNPMASARSLWGMIARAGGRGPEPVREDAGAVPADAPLPVRMAAGWRRFPGPILVILSGDDLTAAEFRDVAATSPAWRGLLEEPRVTVRELPGANHTFSRAEWRDRVADWTSSWVRR